MLDLGLELFLVAPDLVLLGTDHHQGLQLVLFAIATTSTFLLRFVLEFLLALLDVLLVCLQLCL